MDGGRPTRHNFESRLVGPHRRLSPLLQFPGQGRSDPSILGFYLSPTPDRVGYPLVALASSNVDCLTEATADRLTSATLGATKVGRRRIRNFPKAVRTAPAIRTILPPRCKTAAQTPFRAQAS